MTENDSKEPAGDLRPPSTQPEFDDRYDSYRGLADANLVIFVPNRTVPPFRFKAGGWELLQSSVELSSEAKARVAENGYLIEMNNPDSSGEMVARNQDEAAIPSLQVEFALVIGRMIESVSRSPEDIRKVIYDLARYKLQEQLLHAKTEEREHTHLALEVAIRGVEIFSEKHAHTLPPVNQSQPSSLNPPLNRKPPPAPDSDAQFGPRLRLDLQPNAGAVTHKSSPWSYLRRTAAIMAIVVAIAITVRYREGLLSLAYPPMSDHKVAIEEPSASPLVSAAPTREAAMLLPSDYGVYAIGNDALIGLSRVGIATVVTTPSRTELPNGHPKFIVFSRDLRATVGDRAEVRILAKVAREFSPDAAGKKPAEDAWVVRNISFPFRSSPVKGNSEMTELHSDDPELELTPGRYALVLKTQAFDFSVEGKPVDPRHCLERIIGSVGIVYSSCRNP